MSVIQAVSYPVSAVLQSQQQIPPRDSAASPAAPRPSAAPAPVSTDLAAVSSRVNAFVAIEQSAATARSRPDQAEPEATETAGSGGDAVDLDEAQIYQPLSMY